jgi:hypothetical protein
VRIVLSSQYVANLSLCSSIGHCGLPCHMVAGTSDEMTDSLRRVDMIITAAALAEIERIYAASGMKRAGYVPALLKSYPAAKNSTTVQLADPLHPSGGELAELVKELAPRGVSTQPFEWVVGLYETRRVEREDLFEISGIEFALFPGVIDEVIGCKIDFDSKTGQWAVLPPHTGA